jgi:hypothetical protein
MIELTDFGGKAFEHVSHLVEVIGPRPAGSPQEKKAQDYVFQTLEQWGLQPLRFPVRFAPLPGFVPLNFLAGAILAASGWLLGTFPVLAVLLPLIFGSLPDLARWEVRRRKRTQDSENVLALTPDVPGAPLILLVAHVDSARVNGIRMAAWREAFSKAMYICQRISILLALLGVMQILILDLPHPVIMAAGTLASLVGGWFVLSDVVMQSGHRGRYTCGAHDNASGAGVLLAVAEHFAAYPPPRARLGFLFTGAEESGLHGAVSFIEAQHGEPRPDAVISLDMVGTGGTLHYITQDGSIFRKYTHSGLNEALQAACPDIQPLAYSLRSGDFAAFLREKIPAAALQMGGSKAGERAYHAEEDNMEIIRISALDKTAQTVVRCVDIFNVYFNAGSK